MNFPTLKNSSYIILCYVLTFFIFVLFLFIESENYAVDYRKYVKILIPNYESFHHVKEVSNEKYLRLNNIKKVVLYWDKYHNTPWSYAFNGDSPETLRKLGCRVWNCHFTYSKHQFITTADAVIFNPNSLRQWLNLDREFPQQIWIWIETEALYTGMAVYRESLIADKNFSHNFNWTMTYHSSSDIVRTLGYLLPKNYSALPQRPYFKDTTDNVMKSYLQALQRNISLDEDFEKGFFQRPKLVAWMSSHCVTHSRREEYVKELQKYIPVDIYGKCGNLTCLPSGPVSTKCWKKVLRPHYFFYLSMENTLCEDYVTEKLFNPLMHGLVPIVWGGSNYSKFVPPNSFIDARKHTPKNLARLLIRLQSNKHEYAKYHLWRKYWDVYRGSTFCELCYKLHQLNSEQERKDRNDKTFHKNYKRLLDWRNANEKCVDVLPGKWRNYVNEE